MIMVQEIVDSIRRKTGKKGSMTIKVDLGKTYDHVNWDFLEKLLAAMVFEKRRLHDH